MKIIELQTLRTEKSQCAETFDMLIRKYKGSTKSRAFVTLTGQVGDGR